MGEKTTSRVRIFIDGEELDIPMNQEIFSDSEELDMENDTIKVWDWRDFVEQDTKNDDITDWDWRDFWGDTY